MSKTPTDIRSLARAHTEKAINVLVGVMSQEESPPAARVSAASVLLDRGWGKAKQIVAGADDEPPINVLHRIERVIVRPGGSDV